ncbi:hypothetical protein C1H46_001390 [Malus baccata]|uniref:Uncharacterized protein n=1 Tax=Malus baccata TaxID=106549 RepID=A0A540NPR0_MALBA|nr:hypothetical protein C1H46_001390 [Malus baccata]
MESSFREGKNEILIISSLILLLLSFSDMYSNFRTGQSCMKRYSREGKNEILIISSLILLLLSFSDVYSNFSNLTSSSFLREGKRSKGGRCWHLLKPHNSR